MAKWKTYKLSELGKIVGGATPSTKKKEYYGGNISWVTPKDLSTFRGRYINHGKRNITKAGLDSCSLWLMPRHSILFTSRAPIGYVAIANTDMCTNQGFKSIIPNKETDYLFLYYLLKYNVNRIQNMGSGTTFKEVSGSTMTNIEVSAPSDINEQRRIGAVLDSLDSKIEINNRINHCLAA